MKTRTAIILCGGRGTRLGLLGGQLPKTLVRVHGKPILWYILTRLYAAGFRHIILPLGYLGDMIQEFVDHHFSEASIRIDAIPTGDDTEIGKRIALVSHLLPDEGFLLTNGDAIFDFDVAGIADRHDKSGMLATLLTCTVTSNFGLVGVNSGNVTNFTRDSRIQGVVLADGKPAYVYSGMAVIERSALKTVDIASAKNFETTLYPALIQRRQVRLDSIDGFWYAMDTPKDVDIANAKSSTEFRSHAISELHKKLDSVSIRG